tara:strand:- start:274 stop:1389 length:1116 start_codon:yes stop_codon:yes gene_type:complete
MTTKVPVELSSTPGIADSSNATAITITSDENVRIGANTTDTGVLEVAGSKSVSSGIPLNQFTVTDTAANAAGVGGALLFLGRYNSGGAFTSLASVEASKESATSGEYGSSLLLKTRTNGSSNDERMRIDSSGNVGINTSSPAGKLHITNTGGGTTPSNYMRVEGATANNSNYPAIEVKGGTLANVYPSYGMTNGGLGTWITAGYHTSNYNVRAAWSVNNGSLGGYTSSGASYTQTFLVAQNGDTSTNDGTISSLSDERVKTDIKDLTDGLEIVKKLRPVTFKYNDDSTDDEGNFLMASTSDKIRFGFIAQEVEKVAPQYVETITRKIKNVEVDDFKTLSATRMIPMLFKAIQEQQTQIEALQSEINTLKGE